MSLGPSIEGTLVNRNKPLNRSTGKNRSRRRSKTTRRNPLAAERS
jgi:hypothetical protein